MEYILETSRLLLRKIDNRDIDDLFEMDSDPDVRKFIDNNPATSKDQLIQVIDFFHQQYTENGIARWAVIEKESNEFTGWAGLKYFREPLNNHKDIYELGYRFKKKHWGKGFATEAAKAIIEYGFNNLNITSIFAMTHPENQGSIHVLQKTGFEFKETFYYNEEIINWFELTKKSD